jgi:hypothetical protein
MRRAIAFCLAVAAMVPAGCALADDTDGSLRLYAVNIVQDPPQPWTGYGIYLGKGPGHHRRPCRRIIFSDQAERAHRWQRPSRTAHQGRESRAGGFNAPLH